MSILEYSADYRYISGFMVAPNPFLYCYPSLAETQAPLCHEDAVVRKLDRDKVVSKRLFLGDFRPWEREYDPSMVISTSYSSIQHSYIHNVSSMFSYVPPTFAHMTTPSFATNYHPPGDNCSSYPYTYIPYPQNPDPIPSLSPTAPSFSPNPDLQPSYNPPPTPSQPSSFPQFESQVPYQSQSYYPPYDHHQSTPTPSYPLPSSIPSNPNSNFNSNPNSNFNSPYANESIVKFYQSGYGQSGYGQSGSDLGSDRYDSGGYGGEGGWLW